MGGLRISYRVGDAIHCGGDLLEHLRELGLFRVLLYSLATRCAESFRRAKPSGRLFFARYDAKMGREPFDYTQPYSYAATS